MSYASLGEEWDATYQEMGKFSPELYDEVLCCNPEVHAGTVDNITNRNGIKYYMVRLEDGSVDEFADEDVMKRKVA
jgi:hypothetical protein